jgi:hypothetical protein
VIKMIAEVEEEFLNEHRPPNDKGRIAPTGRALEEAEARDKGRIAAIGRALEEAEARFWKLKDHGDFVKELVRAKLLALLNDRTQQINSTNRKKQKQHFYGGPRKVMPGGDVALLARAEQALRSLQARGFAHGSLARDLVVIAEESRRAERGERD